MKWSRAMHHLEELAQSCANRADLPADMFPLRVTQLWAYGDVLASRDDLDALQVALAVDLPVDDFAWFCPPLGAEHWAYATRLSKIPVVTMWRSTRAPVWNHRIRRPLAIWDESGGIVADVLSALRDGTAEALRLPAPTPDEMRSRLEGELAVSHRALVSATDAYEQRRFGRGKIESVADVLWRVSQGYLDVLEASRRQT
jgi:hypothetical protein